MACNELWSPGFFLNLIENRFHNYRDSHISHCYSLSSCTHSILMQVYDESGCQKTSALDAAGSSALAPSEAALKWPSPLYSRKPSELKIPPLTSTRPAMRLSQIQNLDDKVENLAMYTNAEKALSDIQLEPATGSALSRRESALESIRRDSALRASVRDPYLSTKAEDHAGLSTNSYSTGWSAPMDLQENLAESLSDLTDCFVDMEKILAEPPDLTDTEPLVIENILPCWELHEHPPAVVATQLGSLAPLQIDKRVSTLFSQIPTVSATDSIKHFDTTATQPGSLAPRRVSTYFSRRPSELQIPLVSESDAQTPTPMRLSQIQNLDDPTLKIENLAMYTRTAAEKALSDLQLESPMGSFLSRRNSTL